MTNSLQPDRPLVFCLSKIEKQLGLCEALGVDVDLWPCMYMSPVASCAEAEACAISNSVGHKIPSEHVDISPAWHI